MKTEQKSIVFVADNNYILQFLVTLQSLLDNNNENFTIFLITCELSEENKQHLTKWENNNFTKINLLQIDSSELDWLKCMERTWSRFMFLKLYIPYLVPKDIKKIIYLDVDMLIVDNITNLFNININNYALAAVEDTPDCIKHKKRCNIPEKSPYINSGVMILNLEMWRQAAENDLFWSFIKENSKKFAINDQDVINYVFQNKIKTIPLRFNVTNHCFGFKPNVLPYHKKQLKEVYQHPAIIHFTNWNKPWIKGNYHLYKKKWQETEKKICNIYSISPIQRHTTLKHRLVNVSKYILWKIFIIIKYRIWI